jgi:hypothetical protein
MENASVHKAPFLFIRGMGFFVWPWRSILVSAAFLLHRPRSMQEIGPGDGKGFGIWDKKTVKNIPRRRR